MFKSKDVASSYESPQVICLVIVTIIGAFAHLLTYDH